VIWLDKVNDAVAYRDVGKGREPERKLCARNVYAAYLGRSVRRSYGMWWWI